MAEKMTWPENAWPTPEQWLEWFESLTPKRKLEVTEQVCQNAELAAECVAQDHVGQIVGLKDRVQTLIGLGVRLHTAWRSARLRARNYRLLVDSAIAHEQSIKRSCPPSQSDPEALPACDSDAPDQREGEG